VATVGGTTLLGAMWPTCLCSSSEPDGPQRFCNSEARGSGGELVAISGRVVCLVVAFDYAGYPAFEKAGCCEVSCIPDAMRFAAFAEVCGANVMQFYDRPLSESYAFPRRERLLAELFILGHDLGPDDVLVLFFAGHGARQQQSAEEQLCFVEPDGSASFLVEDDISTLLVRDFHPDTRVVFITLCSHSSGVCDLARSDLHGRPLCHLSGVRSGNQCAKDRLVSEDFMGALLETVEGITSRRDQSVIDVFNSWLSSFDAGAESLEMSFERALGFDPDTFPWPLLPPKGWSSKALASRKNVLDGIMVELGTETAREPVATLSSTQPVVPAVPAPPGTGLNPTPIPGPPLQPPPSWGAIPNDWEPRVRDLMKFFPCLGREVIVTALLSSKGHVDMAVPVLRAHLVASAQADRLQQQQQVHSSGRSEGSPASRNQSFSPPLPCAAVRQQQIQQHLLQQQSQQVQQVPGQMHLPSQPQLLINGGSGCSVRCAPPAGAAAASTRRTRSVSPPARASLHASSSGDLRFAASRQATPSRACIQLPLVERHSRSLSPPPTRSASSLAPTFAIATDATPTRSAICLPPPTRLLCRSPTDQKVVPLHVERSISTPGGTLLDVTRSFSASADVVCRTHSVDRPMETSLQTVRPFTPRGPPLSQRRVHVSSGDVLPHASATASSASSARILVPALPLSVLGASSPAAGGHVQPVSGGTTPRYASTPRGQPPATAEATAKSDALVKAAVAPLSSSAQANTSLSHRRPHIRGINSNAAPLRSSSANVTLSPRRPASQRGSLVGLNAPQPLVVHPRQDTSRTMDHLQRP